MAIVSCTVGRGRAGGSEVDRIAAQAARAAAPSAASAGTTLPLDQASEVMLAAPSRLPLLGPRYALVTLDLFVAVGQKGSDINLALAMRRVAEADDVRLRLHPVTTGPLAERGAEVMWEAFEQLPAGCYPFYAQLLAHPDWLAATADGLQALLTAATAAGLDAQRLRLALRGHRHRALVTAHWQALREQVRYPPELWINGRRLRGTLTEAQLREELDGQRVRAQRALLQSADPTAAAGGVLLTQLYERLIAEEAAQRSEGSPGSISRRWGRVPSPPPPPPSGPLPLKTAPRLALTDLPSRGPRISPVTMVLVGSLDSYGTYSVARAASEVWARHKDSVRLMFLQAPRTESSQRIAVLLTQVALLDPGRFWRLFDGILEVLPRRFFLRLTDIEDLIRREGSMAWIEAGLRTPLAEARVQKDLEQARRLGIENSPLVLVNGLPVRGAPLAEALESAIERESQRGLLQRLHTPPQRVDYGWLTR